MSQPDDLEGGLTAEQVSAIFNERAAIFDLINAVAEEADPERIKDLFERYEEAAQVRSELGLTDHQLGSSESIRIEAMAGDRPVKALFIPADPSRPVQVIEVSGRDDLRQHVGGLPEPTRYDHDSLMYVSDTGRIDGQPMNVRATNYIRMESDAAWERGGQLTDDPTYGLYGDVVVIGGNGQGLHDVPDRLTTRFGVSPAVDRIGDRIRNGLGDRSEDGMIRIPWFRDRSESYESPSPGWSVEKTDGRTVYYRTGTQWEGYAAVWKDRGRWTIDFALDPQSPMFQADLGKTRSVEKALNRADLTIMSAAVEVHQNHRDMRTVVNLAAEIEDVTPDEQASIGRLQESLIEGLSFPDPSEDWIEVFDHEAQERENERDEDRGQGY
jgi:hypothetical protein